MLPGTGPRNPAGWLLLGIAACLGLSIDSGLYAVADYRLRHGTLPLGPAVLLFSPLWAPAVVAFGLVVLLFPDGRLASWRWRWVVRAYLVVGACWLLSIYAVTVRAITGHNIHIMPNGDLSLIDHPSGSAAWLPWAEAVILPLLVVFWLAFLGQAAAQLAGRGRRAAAAAEVADRAGPSSALLPVAPRSCPGLSAPTSRVPEQVMMRRTRPRGGRVAGRASASAILKYRLYEIDRIISRTLAYAIVTGLLVGVYAGLVLLTTRDAPDPYPGGGGRLHAGGGGTVQPGAAAGAEGQWTGGSTGPATTPTRPWPRSPPG